MSISTIALSIPSPNNAPIKCSIVDTLTPNSLAIVVFNENPTFTKETIVETDFENAAVTMFTATWCGYCKGAKQLLDEKGISYFEVDVEEYNISKRKLKEIGIEDFFVPQIFVDGIPIGGFSDLKKIFGSDMPVPKVS